MPSPPDTAVLIPAGGRGTRMGGEPKQFRPLGGAPLLLQTLRVFDRHPAVRALVVATLPERINEVEAWRTELSKLRAVVAGGASRQASVAAALEAAPAAADVVLVHDAARPFIEPRHVSAVIEAVRAYGAAALAIPVADTLRRVGDGGFGPTVPREGLYRMQTPQGFRRDLFEEAHARAGTDGFTGTDDVELVQRLGHGVRVVEGSMGNLKITRPEDWALAERTWAALATPPSPPGE